MNAQRQLAKDEPLMVAWEAFQNTEEFANAKKWAETVELRHHDGQLTVTHQHLQGAIWGVFMAAWKIAAESICEHSKVTVRSNGLMQCEACGKDAPL